MYVEKSPKNEIAGSKGMEIFKIKVKFPFQKVC